MTSVFESLMAAQKLVSRSEARILLAATLKKSKEFLIAHPETELSREEESLFGMYLDRAHKGEPIPYITGVQEFWGRPFSVTPATLIPRPDTETLIEHALKFLRQKPTSRVLDLGTGSGCIAVTLALECPQACIWACDISSQALCVAKHNSHTLGAAVSFIESDWFGAFENETFDLIVSNPPYIEEADEHLKALTYEPISALTSGADGLKDIRKLAASAPKYLRSDGCIIVEHGYNQGPSVAAIFRQSGFSNVHTIQDLGGNPRICCARN